MSDRPGDAIPVDALVPIAAGHAGVASSAIRLRLCPTGKFNTTYFVEGTERPLVLRVAPPDDPGPLLFYEYGMMRQEPGIHEIVRTRTTAPVPAIIAHDFTHEQIDRDYLIMERAPGDPISDHAGLTRSKLDRLLGQVGEALRQVHAIHGDAYGYVGPHVPMVPQGNWTEAFVIMWHRLIDDTLRCEGYTEDEATHMRRLLDGHMDAFDRAEPASLLHMDVWAQNILADEEGHLTALLDWDRGLWGDPEIEFAVLDYCGISEPAFWEGYGQCRDASRAAEVRRVFYLLYEMQKYILIRRVRGRSPREADAYRQRCFQLARQLG